eukprot:CAMPEP_0197025438 /NCGR_PEP_ID=MMETSP1384-20130603/5779_1 /TAXON_ID=29189 /ORGANISM="Ammonia sp." /LENGTH=187 /DNA_ID=CAMNT_0042453967 /DNA_START=116 /DNA_END=679 /DNA_ORIENTATION=-
MPEKKFDIGDEPEQEAQHHEKTMSIRERAVTKEEELIYDASSRGGCYHCIRVLWCGCFEPYAHITTRYVKETRWEGCSKKTDSMAFENIKDVQRQQTCCCLMASFAPCCCCVNDMGDIVLFGSDASEQSKSEKKGVHVTSADSEKWVLKRVSDSFETFERITGHLQELHADWRKVGRNLGRKVQQIK